MSYAQALSLSLTLSISPLLLLYRRPFDFTRASLSSPNRLIEIEKFLLLFSKCKTCCKIHLEILIKLIYSIWDQLLIFPINILISRTIFLHEYLTIGIKKTITNSVDCQRPSIKLTTKFKHTHTAPRTDMQKETRSIKTEKERKNTTTPTW